MRWSVLNSVRAKDVKEKFSFLRHHGDPSPGSGKESKPSRPNASAVRSWSKSLDALLHDKSNQNEQANLCSICKFMQILLFRAVTLKVVLKPSVVNLAALENLLLEF